MKKQKRLLSVPSILVIENDPDLCKMIVWALEPSKCSVVTAYDGSSGMMVLQEMIPDLVVLDLGLPYISGQEILAYIRREPRLANVKIVVVTVMDETQTRTIRPQVEHVFQKPYPLSEFRKVIDKLIAC